MAKVILKVMDNRLKGTVEEHVDKMQFGFRKEKGTWNAIFGLRAIIERAIEKHKDLYLYFVDFECPSICFDMRYWWKDQED